MRRKWTRDTLAGRDMSGTTVGHIGLAVAAFMAVGAWGQAQAQSLNPQSLNPQPANAAASPAVPTVTLDQAERGERLARNPGQNPSQTSGANLRLNENGRWGLDFNLSQPIGREADWGDVEAGAYYRVNPRLRVGAAAGLATPTSDPARARETEGRTQPRVRLESTFRF